MGYNVVVPTAKHIFIFLVEDQNMTVHVYYAMTGLIWSQHRQYDDKLGKTYIILPNTKIILITFYSHLTYIVYPI